MSNKDESSSGLSLPQDLSLPLFVYGSLKPGMPAFESISKLVLNDPESAQVVGALYLRDGLPLLFLNGSKKILKDMFLSLIQKLLGMNKYVPLNQKPSISGQHLRLPVDYL